MSNDISPIDAARAVTPKWLLRIWQFDALEIQPCAMVAPDGMHTATAEPCEPAKAQVWTVCGHLRKGGVDAFEDFVTEAEARAFHDGLIAICPHLAAWEG